MSNLPHMLVSLRTGSYSTGKTAMKVLIAFLNPLCLLLPSQEPSIKVVPGEAVVRQRETQTFRVEVLGIENQSVAWSVRNSRGEVLAGAGTVTDNGVYKPGNTTGRYFFIRATSLALPDLFGEAKVEVLPAAGPDLIVFPDSAQVLLGKPVQFTLFADGLEVLDARWSIRDSNGKVYPENACGTIDARGFFTAGGQIGKYFYIWGTRPDDEKHYGLAKVEILSPNEIRTRNIPWQTLKKLDFQLVYSPEQVDAEQVASYAENCLSFLKSYFSGLSPQNPLQNAEIRIHVHPFPVPEANESTATLNTETKGEIYTADLHLLSPSLHGPSRQKASYQKYLIGHELSTIFLDRITRSKPKGWRFHSAPSWFVQGYEEYLGLLCTDEEYRNGTLERRREDLALRPDSLAAGWDKVEKVYEDGSLLVHFLHEEFGKEKMAGLLRSSKNSFEEALADGLEVSREGLEERFRSWLEI